MAHFELFKEENGFLVINFLGLRDLTGNLDPSRPRKAREEKEVGGLNPFLKLVGLAKV